MTDDKFVQYIEKEKAYKRSRVKRYQKLYDSYLAKMVKYNSTLPSGRRKEPMSIQDFIAKKERDLEKISDPIKALKETRDNLRAEARLLTNEIRRLEYAKEAEKKTKRKKG